jgi:hypothetical protein
MAQGTGDYDNYEEHKTRRYALQIAKYSPDVQAMLSIFQLHLQLTNRAVAEVSVQIANRIELEHDDV